MYCCFGQGHAADTASQVQRHVGGGGTPSWKGKGGPDSNTGALMFTLSPGEEPARCTTPAAVRFCSRIMVLGIMPTATVIMFGLLAMVVASSSRESAN